MPATHILSGNHSRSVRPATAEASGRSPETRRPPCVWTSRRKSGDTDPANGVILREVPRKALRPAGKPGADRRISTLGAPSRRLRLALVRETPPVSDKDPSVGARAAARRRRFGVGAFLRGCIRIPCVRARMSFRRRRHTARSALTKSCAPTEKSTVCCWCPAEPLRHWPLSSRVVAENSARAAASVLQQIRRWIPRPCTFWRESRPRRGRASE
jgi:hypothetical protein